jgi:hypothetical protein
MLFLLDFMCREISDICWDANFIFVAAMLVLRVATSLTLLFLLHHSAILYIFNSLYIFSLASPIGTLNTTTTMLILLYSYLFSYLLTYPIYAISSLASPIGTLNTTTGTMTRQRQQTPSPRAWSKTSRTSWKIWGTRRGRRRCCPSCPGISCRLVS